MLTACDWRFDPPPAIELDAAGIDADRDALQEIDAATDPMREVVGTSSAEIPRTDSCGNLAGIICESAIGNVVADSMRVTYSTDVALTNSGGLRDALTCPAIDVASDFCDPSEPPPFLITRGQMSTAVPFGNLVVTVSLSGIELRAILEHSVAILPAPLGRFVQLSGMCFTYDPDQPSGSRVVGAVRQMPDGSCTGAAVDLTAGASFTLATTDYIGAGGAGFPVPTGTFTTRDLDVEVLADWLASQGPITPMIQGRVACVSSGAAVCPETTTR